MFCQRLLLDKIPFAILVRLLYSAISFCSSSHRVIVLLYYSSGVNKLRDRIKGYTRSRTFSNAILSNRFVSFSVGLILASFVRSFFTRLLSESSICHNETDALRGLVLTSLRKRKQLLSTGHREKMRTHCLINCYTQSALGVLAESKY